MNYSKIGAQLKLVRERKGLSHYQVFEVTKIQPSILKGIEEGKADVAPVFLKSFIKTYCQCLGLDFQKLLEETTEKNLEEIEQSANGGKNLKDTRAIKTGLKNKLKYFFPIAGLVILFQLLAFLGLAPQIFKNRSQDKPVTEELKTALTKNEEIKAIQKIQPLEDVTQKTPLSQSLFEKVTKLAFRQEVLIQSSNPLTIYFKADNRSTVNKTLNPFTWYYIKTLESLYLRFDDKPGDIQLFHNGEQIDLGSNNFFERKFE